ncbi:hypothetical protein BKA56DRAFT_147889 [Ilyonectria sp. MPI-CAGE-AT-0026]|nr:hypothetical protein BKA56DRAFT_147889 [Ilyonectria sp. MPI-CAGE-AT-0026]
MGRRLGVSLSGWIGWLLLRVLSLVDLRWIEDGGFFWTRVEGRGPCHKDQRPPKYPPPYPRPHCSHFPRTSAWEPSSACLLPAILVPCVGLLNWSFFFYYHPVDPICFLPTTDSRVSCPKSQQPRVSRHLSVFSVSLSPSSPTPVLPFSRCPKPRRLCALCANNALLSPRYSMRPHLLCPRLLCFIFRLPFLLSSSTTLPVANSPYSRHPSYVAIVLLPDSTAAPSAVAGDAKIQRPLPAARRAKVQP